MSYPTDLSPGERELAQARLRELAERFTADGILRTPQWRDVFERTWRHPYVPSFYPTLDGPCLLSIDPRRRDDWLAAVYSDQTLITKVVQVPMSPALRPGSYPVYTSSSTMPSLVLRMLEALDVHDGYRVLEIGTGTGYNAALLCARLGSEHVTSVDIDPELIELAAERLAANGYTPTLAAVDGAAGYPPGAPYDRIIATCAVPAIPPAWLAQAEPGGVILADVHGPIGGTLARLTINPDGVATGRFLPDWAGFMWLRHTPGVPAPPPQRWVDDEPVESVSAVDPALVSSDGLFGFVAQWHLPDVTWGPATEHGEAAIHLWAPDGSRAAVRTTRTNGAFPVSQVGPRRLWDRVEEAHTFWQRAGRPRYEQFGITATTTSQYIWYQHPDSEHRWPLPLPADPGGPNPAADERPG
ncbi:MAG: ATP-grasp peptide maturase system methyltransferase [Pseudonocardiaceae bacterium]